MKNNFLILILFVTTLCFSQKKECTIYLVDGTTKEGICRFKADDKVKFRVTEDSEAEIIPKEAIEKIKLDENGIIGTYRYKNVTDEGGMWLKEVSALGEVCLYSNKIPGKFYSPMGGVSMGKAGSVVAPKVMMKSNDVIDYYICHKTDATVLNIASKGAINFNFKKVASAFFKDCPKLVEKIQSKEYKKDDIESVVWFYNNYCVTK
jgi:hypothetical protein